MLETFAARALHAAVVGRVGEGYEISVASQGRSALIRRFTDTRLMGLGRGPQ